MEIVMLKSIQYCYKNNKVVSFYLDKEDTNSHLTGYINCYNDNEILISHITARGEYDGFILKRVGEVYRIDYDGEYEKKIEMLYKLKLQTHARFDASDKGILYPLLDFAIKMKYIVNLELGDNFVTGFVGEYDDDFIYISVVNKYGKEDGISIINIDEIITFSCDTDDEQDLKLVYNNIYAEK